jgi:hypothetical protein
MAFRLGAFGADRDKEEIQRREKRDSSIENSTTIKWGDFGSRFR